MQAHRAWQRLVGGRRARQLAPAGPRLRLAAAVGRLRGRVPEPVEQLHLLLRVLPHGVLLGQVEDELVHASAQLVREVRASRARRARRRRRRSAPASLRSLKVRSRTCADFPLWTRCCSAPSCSGRSTSPSRSTCWSTAGFPSRTPRSATSPRSRSSGSTPGGASARSGSRAPTGSTSASPPG